MLESSNFAADALVLSAGHADRVKVAGAEGSSFGATAAVAAAAANCVVAGTNQGDATQQQVSRRRTRARRSSPGAAAATATAAVTAAVLCPQQQEEVPGSDHTQDTECATLTKQFSASTGKQLTSRYRGVCWNKKNKRWQAAINSGGKYIYLGSFTSEDDAARQFDRAAIQIRGKKAKLNFAYADYLDADGYLSEDLVLPESAGIVKPSKLSKQQHISPTAAADSAAAPLGLQDSGSRDTTSSQVPTVWRQEPHQQQQQQFQQRSAAHMLQQQTAPHPPQQLLLPLKPGHQCMFVTTAVEGITAGLLQPQQYELPLQEPSETPGSPRPGVTPHVLAPAMTPGSWKTMLPLGCTLDVSVVGQHGLYGLVFKCDVTRQQGCGVWTGQRFKVFGVHRDMLDALQTVFTALNLLEQHAGAQQQQQQAMSSPPGAADSSAIGLHMPVGVNRGTSHQAAAIPSVTAVRPPPPAAAGYEPLAATACSSGGLSALEAYCSMAPSTSAMMTPGSSLGLIPASVGVIDRASMTSSLSARLASCDLSEALGLARQAAAEHGISDLAAALRQMSSSSNSRGM